MATSADAVEAPRNPGKLVDLQSWRQAANGTEGMAARDASGTLEQGSSLLPRHAPAGVVTPPDQFTQEPAPNMLKAALAHLRKGRSVFPVCSVAADGIGCNEHGSQCENPSKKSL